MATIWETVTVGDLAVGDIMAWNGDTEYRMKVTRVWEHRGYPTISVAGPDDRWTRGHGVTTSNAYANNLTLVRRMKRECAATVGPNFRTVRKGR